MQLARSSDDRLATQKNALNMQWSNSQRNMGRLSNFIAMVDTSDSMNCDGKKAIVQRHRIGLLCR